MPHTNFSSSHYAVTDDGAEANIWDKVGSGFVLDNMNRKVVHFRWVLMCITKNEILDDCDQLHLLPLP
jgi:hypothetical protein